MLGEGWEPRGHLEEERRKERKDHSKKASSRMTLDPDWL